MRRGGRDRVRERPGPRSGQHADGRVRAGRAAGHRAARTRGVRTGPDRRRMMSKDTLTVTDNRTGKSCEIAITDGAIRATELRQLKSGPDDVGLLTYDPAFMNTASTRSALSV